MSTCENIILGDFDCRLDQDAHVSHMNVLGCLTNPVGSTENEMRLLIFCERNFLYAVSSFFSKNLEKYDTWYHPRTGQGTVLDFYLTSLKVVTFLDIRADANSDHCLVTSDLRIEAIPEKSLRHIDQTRIWQQNKEIDLIWKYKYQEMFEKKAVLKHYDLEYDVIINVVAKTAGKVRRKHRSKIWKMKPLHARSKENLHVKLLERKEI